MPNAVSWDVGSHVGMLCVFELSASGDGSKASNIYIIFLKTKTESD